jgi:hypothetical protein
MLRCASAMADVEGAADSTMLARAAWVNAISDPAQEATFLRRWASSLTAEDEWQRFQRLAWRDVVAAPRKPITYKPPRTARGEPNAPHSEWVSLAASDNCPQRAVASKFNVVRHQRHKLRAAGEEVVAERQQRAIAQAPRTVGLDGEALLEMNARHPLGLTRAARPKWTCCSSTPRATNSSAA